MRVCDCFTFLNELDLLEIRLEELKDVVDRFVLVEAALMHSGRPKPLHYEGNRGRFGEFQGRIRHVAVQELPSGSCGWIRENYQRNALAFGWNDCSPDDLILVSDVDEIPSPSSSV